MLHGHLTILSATLQLKIFNFHISHSKLIKIIQKIRPVVSLTYYHHSKHSISNVLIYSIQCRTNNSIKNFSN